jgi:hypothetical protein
MRGRDFVLVDSPYDGLTSEEMAKLSAIRLLWQAAKEKERQMIINQTLEAVARARSAGTGASFFRSLIFLGNSFVNLGSRIMSAPIIIIVPKGCDIHGALMGTCGSDNGA